MAIYNRYDRYDRCDRCDIYDLIPQFNTCLKKIFHDQFQLNTFKSLIASENAIIFSPTFLLVNLNTNPFQNPFLYKQNIIEIYIPLKDLTIYFDKKNIKEKRKFEHFFNLLHFKNIKDKYIYICDNNYIFENYTCNFLNIDYKEIKQFETKNNQIINLIYFECKNKTRNCIFETLYKNIIFPIDLQVTNIYYWINKNRQEKIYYTRFSNKIDENKKMINPKKIIIDQAQNLAYMDQLFANKIPFSIYKCINIYKFICMLGTIIKKTTNILINNKRITLRNSNNILVNPNNIYLKEDLKEELKEQLKEQLKKELEELIDNNSTFCDCDYIYEDGNKFKKCIFKLFNIKHYHVYVSIYSQPRFQNEDGNEEGFIENDETELDNNNNIFNPIQ